MLLLASCGDAQPEATTPKVNVVVPASSVAAAPVDVRVPVVDAGSMVFASNGDTVDAGDGLPPIPRIGQAAYLPFAHYAVAMHNRIHPLFADQFLASLDKLPAGHPMNDMKIVTTVEITLNRDGSLNNMGVIKTSGITAFDVATLDSIKRAAPFGTAPPEILSDDGFVRIRWGFHRDPVYSCSTMNVWPIMLRGKNP